VLLYKAVRGSMRKKFVAAVGDALQGKSAELLTHDGTGDMMFAITHANFWKLDKVRGRPAAAPAADGAGGGVAGCPCAALRSRRRRFADAPGNRTRSR